VPWLQCPGVLTRVLTAAALLPIVVAVYFAPPWVFLVLAVAAALAATRETVRLHEAHGARPLEAAALAGAGLACLSFFAPAHLPLSLVIWASLALAFALHAILRRSLDGALPDVAATIACVAYPGILIAFQVALRGLPSPPDLPHRATALLVFLYAVVFGNDAAAYFSGRAFGRLKLAPSISPGKTVEGFLGGIVGGVLLGIACSRILPCGLSLGEAAGFGTLVAIAAVFGDLSKSMLKRSAHVKDSGKLLPGHGGVLDRLDGLLFAGPLLYFLLTARASIASPAGSP
jgi:phosphatidate cytidylyltransferase